MQGFFEELGLLDLTELTITIRLLMAALFSALLGLERTRKRRPAGLRTYMLVCIGSTVVMLTSQFMTEFFSVDPGRMPAQIVAGIGFLGAGTIMVTRYNRVKGLTTAAGLWGVACLGIAIGIGFYFCAIITLPIMLFVMGYADNIENAYTRRLRRLAVFVIFNDVTDLKPFMRNMKEHDIVAFDVETTKSDNKQGIGLFCVLKLPLSIERSSAMQLVEKSLGVLFAEEIND